MVRACNGSHAPAGSDTLRGFGRMHRTPLDHYLTLGQQVVFQSLELQEVPISPKGARVPVAGSGSAYLGESLGFSLMINFLAGARRQPLWGARGPETHF